jgi:hypothetical protein
MNKKLFEKVLAESTFSLSVVIIRKDHSTKEILLTGPISSKGLQELRAMLEEETNAHVKCFSVQDGLDISKPLRTIDDVLHYIEARYPLH